MTAVTLRAALLLLAAGEAACVDLSVNQPTTTVWETQLAPDPAYPDLSGQAAAISQSDGTSVGIGIDGATPGAQHVWALRSGSCTAPGQQIGTDGDYPVLAVSGTGSASGDTHLATRLVLGRAYYVEVRVSATDSARIACGDLVAR